MLKGDDMHRNTSKVYDISVLLEKELDLFVLLWARFELFSDVWSENTALFERLMEIH